MINPFDLYGSQFLVFYVMLSAVVHFLVRFYIRIHETELPMPSMSMNDPYQIAYMRDGVNEAIKVATISLIDRRLLHLTEGRFTKKMTLQTVNPRHDIAHRNIEQSILRFFSISQLAYKALDDKGCQQACNEYKENLGAHGLIRNGKVLINRLPITLFAGALLSIVAMVKVNIGLERDSSIDLLAFFAGSSVIMLYPVLSKHSTGLGDRMMKDLEKQCALLYQRRAIIKPGSETNEASLLAAVFGVSVLVSSFSYVKTLFPEAYNLTCGDYCDGIVCGGRCRGRGA